MKKYLPNNSELRIAFFTAIVTILLFVIGHTVVKSVNGSMHKEMGMYKKEMKGMHKMPDGSVMMNHDSEMDMMDMTMRDMIDMMEGKTGKALEKEFILGMIPHHQGAVDMAKKLLQDKTISAEMKKFAEQIISAQESEIEMMNGWLKKY